MGEAGPLEPGPGDAQWRGRCWGRGRQGGQWAGMVPDWALTGWRSLGRCLACPGLDASFTCRDGAGGIAARQRPGAGDAGTWEPCSTQGRRPLHPRPPVLLLLIPGPGGRHLGAAVSLSSFPNILTWGSLPVGAVVLPRWGGPLPLAEAHAVRGRGFYPVPGDSGPPALPAAMASGHALLLTHRRGAGLPPEVSP